MDNIFNAYSEKYGEDLTALNGKFVVSYDTSCLLNLYRYSRETRSEIVDLLKRIGANYGHFIPHHVALEFSVNKEKAKNDTQTVFTGVRASFNNFKSTVKNVAQSGGFSTPLSQLSTNISSYISKIQEELDKERAQLLKNNDAEDIFDLVAKLFSEKVSQPFTIEEIKAISNEGVARYEKKIPPGFEDGSKSDFLNFNGHAVEAKFGDLIIWKQLIEYSKKHTVNIIFITSDQKPDWMVPVKNNKWRIRPDLANEFKHETEMQVFCLSLKDFENTFKSELQYSFSKDTKSELVRIEKENGSLLTDVVAAFEHFNGEVSLQDLYSYLKKNSGRTFPPSWQSMVRKTIYNHSSDVNAYLGKADLFERTSKGNWKLR